MSRIIFAIGSNVGDREKFLDMAKKSLKDQLHLKEVKCSTILQNKAMLLPDSPKSWDIDFLNIAFSGNIDLDKFNPLKILEIIKLIEVEVGRVNRGKWSPREIDIDILAIDELRFSYDDKLTIPHIDLFNRDFFTTRFSEIEPDIFNKLLNDKALNDKVLNDRATS